MSEEGTGPVFGRWYPIETAPKDGTQVLVCQAVGADGNPIDPLSIFCHVAAWWSNEEDPSDSGEWVVYCSLPSEPALFFDPTHWMPLPPNPLWSERSSEVGELLRDEPHPAIVVQACVWYFANVDPREQLEAARGAPLERRHHIDEYVAEKFRDHFRGFVHWFNRLDPDRQRAWVDAALRRFAVETIAAPFHPGWLTADVARSLAHLLTEHARRLEAEGGS